MFEVDSQGDKGEQPGVVAATSLRTAKPHDGRNHRAVIFVAMV
jgi:hypothetical protein